MAATYRAMASNVVFGNNKSMIALWNGAGSADILKVNRIWVLNNQVGSAAGTGVLITLELRKITAYTGATKIFPVKLKKTSSDLDSNVAASFGATVTDATELLRRLIWSGDEPAQSELTTDTWQLLQNINCIWNTGYYDTNTEPLVLNASEGIHVKCATSTSATFLGNVIIEFTT